jgi:hypothetical protein
MFPVVWIYFWIIKQDYIDYSHSDCAWSVPAARTKTDDLQYMTNEPETSENVAAEHNRGEPHQTTLTANSYGEERRGKVWCELKDRTWREGRLDEGSATFSLPHAALAIYIFFEDCRKEINNVVDSKQNYISFTKRV